MGKMSFFMVFPVIAALLFVIGCGPKIVCEPPSKVIDGVCCLDLDDDMVCDVYDGSLDKDTGQDVVLPEQGLNDEVFVDEPLVVAPVKIPAVAEEVPETVERKPGKSKILEGEPRKYITLDSVEMHRYSYDKVQLDYIWYTVRNIGHNTLTPEVRIRVEGVLRPDQDWEGLSNREYKYNLDPLAPGQKQVVRLGLDARFGQINKSRDLTVEVYERYVSPKVVKGEDVLSFVPLKALDSTEISWTYRGD